MRSGWRRGVRERGAHPLARLHTHAPNVSRWRQRRRWWRAESSPTDAKVIRLVDQQAGLGGVPLAAGLGEQAALTLIPTQTPQPQPQPQPQSMQVSAGVPALLAPRGLGAAAAGAAR